MATRARVQTIVKSNRTPQILAAMRLAGKSHVTVGVHEGAGEYKNADGTPGPPVSKVALWLEYGTSNMPARPFMYPAIKRNEGGIAKVAAKALVDIAYLGARVETGLARIGSFVVRQIQNVIKSNVGPALSGSWDEPREGYLGWRHTHYPEAGQRTLYRSGLLLRSVAFRVHLDRWTQAKQAQAEPVRDDAAPAKGVHKAKTPAFRSDGLRHAAEQKAQARAQARMRGEAIKAQHRAQKAAANADPKAHAAAFAAQKRAYTRAPKGTP